MRVADWVRDFQTNDFRTNDTPSPHTSGPTTQARVSFMSHIWKRRVTQPSASARGISARNVFSVGTFDTCIHIYVCIYINIYIYTWIHVDIYIYKLIDIRVKSANFNSTYVGTHNLCPRIFHIIHMMQICSNPLPVPAHLSCHTYERVVVVQHSHVPASARAEWRVPISDQNTHGPTMHARVSFMSHIRKRRYHTGMVLMHAELRMLITNPHT